MTGSKRLCAAFCAVLLLFTLFSPIRSHADALSKAQEIAAGIEAYALSQSGAASVQEWVDGELTENAGATSEWYILALCQQDGAYDVSGYAAALEAYVDGDARIAAVTAQKYALVLHACGSTSPFIAETASSAVGQQGIMSWVYGLHLLHHGYTSDSCSTDEIVETILSLQLPDGGWAISGEVSDADVTAMVLQALAPHSDAHASAIDRAVSLLADRQLPDGDFASYGVPNPESTAQVLTALCALGIDPITDARFLKNGSTLLDGIAKYRQSDGSFSHTLGGAFNHNATVQAYCAMTAYVQYCEGRGSFYAFTPQDAAATGGGSSVKWWICLGIGVAGGLACVVLFLRKKRNPKHYLAVLLCTAAGIVLVGVTDIRSAEEYYGAATASPDAIGTVTLTIRCDTAAAESGDDHIPADGVILDTAEFPLAEGDTVFDLLTKAAQAHSIQMEYSGTPEMAYVSGIGYLYEFDYGDLSGWVYRVNGESPSVGCGEYVLKDGDEIAWHYSLDLGNDIP